MQGSTHLSGKALQTKAAEPQKHELTRAQRTTHIGVPAIGSR